MKTAMQELMDALNDLEAVYIQNDWRREVIGINQAKNLIEHIYLKKEKEQIMDAWEKGASPEPIDTTISGYEYYHETFDTEEK
jgi:predicted metalloenzyme YecM